MIGVDQKINEWFAPVADFVAGLIFYSVEFSGHSIPLILVWLMAVSFFTTVYFGFINIRYFKHGIDVLRGKFDRDDDAGEINRFQALTTTLSGTVGLGNIAGVAVAVSGGGPGAVVWMVLMGLFGMSTKFMEAALGVKYRHRLNDGRFSGGPMHYLHEAFRRRGMGKLGLFLGGIFAVCCIGGSFGGGNMFQANQAYMQVVNVTGGETSFFADKGWLFGLILAFMVGVVIIGGIKSIANVASRIVPIMGAIYLLAGLVVIGANYSSIPEALQLMLNSAFSTEAGIGGLLGAIIQGIRRAVFSNEAGIGSAGIAHAVAKTDQPISQGFVAMLGPFIDTVVICLVTALVIVFSGVYTQYGGDVTGVTLTSHAFGSVFSWFPDVLALTVFLFAYSTMIAWSYYGMKSFTFLFGESKASELIYKFIFCAFCVVGATSELGNVLNFSDAMIFAMAIPNVIALYMFAPEIKGDLKAYLKNMNG